MALSFYSSGFPTNDSLAIGDVKEAVAEALPTNSTTFDTSAGVLRSGDDTRVDED